MISFQREQLFLVTGASSGMGRATTLLLTELGASVAALGRSEAKLEAVRQASSCPEAVHIYPYDLTREPDDVTRLVNEIRERHGKLAGLCSCAGTMRMDSLRGYDRQQGTDMFTLHVAVPLLLARAVTDRRNCVGAGTSLVFIAALGGTVPQAGLLSYGAAKAALIAAAKSLSREVGSRQIRVNCVSPALVRTPMTERDYAGLMGYDVLAAEAPNYPLGVGEPEDVAAAAVFLLSDRARWISGRNLVLDGGRY